jgi:hypothetical protein
VRQLYTSPNVALVNHLRSILDALGIPCRVRGEFLSAAVGELPPIECWAELWVVDDDRYDDAMDVIRKASGDTDDDAPAWTCEDCGERVEGIFGECWQCGGVRSDLERAG